MNLPSHIPAQESDRVRWTALMVVCLAQLMIVLDVTIVNVALPSIQHDLHFSQGSLTWVVNAFLVTFGSLMLLAGRLGDLIGRKRVFLAGLVTFTAASLLCGLAPTQGALIGARLLQGIGAAAQASVILAIIVIEFPEAAERWQREARLQSELAKVNALLEEHAYASAVSMLLAMRTAFLSGSCLWRNEHTEGEL